MNEYMRNYDNMRYREEQCDGCFRGKILAVYLLISIALGIRFAVYGISSGYLTFGPIIDNNVRLVIGMTILLCIGFSGIIFGIFMLFELIRMIYLKIRLKQAEDKFYNYDPQKSYGIMGKCDRVHWKNLRRG